MYKWNSGFLFSFRFARIISNNGCQMKLVDYRSLARFFGTDIFKIWLWFYIHLMGPTRWKYWTHHRLLIRKQNNIFSQKELKKCSNRYRNHIIRFNAKWDHFHSSQKELFTDLDKGKWTKERVIACLYFYIILWQWDSVYIIISKILCFY